MYIMPQAENNGTDQLLVIRQQCPLLHVALRQRSTQTQVQMQLRKTYQELRNFVPRASLACLRNV